MGFWNALSVLAPVAPAMAAGQDIRAQRQQEQESFAQDQALKDAQLTAQKLAAQAEEQRIKQEGQPQFIGQPQWNPLTHTNQVLTFDRNTGALALKDVPGVDPGSVADAKYKEALDEYAKTTGQTPTPELRDAIFAAAYQDVLPGIKAPAAGSLKNIPGAQPYQDPNTHMWVKPMLDPYSNVVNVPLGEGYTPPPRNTPINTEYVRVMGKDPSTWTPQEQQFIRGYGAYLKAQEALAGARGSAYNASRPVQVQDPNNPGNAIIMPAGQAEALGVPTTQSIPFRVQYATQSALNRYFTAGKGGENIRTLNTAVAHLGLLRQLSDALGNGDIRMWNALRQSYARATGSAAPVNFDMLRDSLAGEMARVFTGVGATQQEIAEITGPISNANSPAQLSGAIDTAQAAMNSRLQALKEQYAAGRQGLPAFQGAGNTSVAPLANSGGKSGGSQTPADPVTQFLLTVPGGK